MPTDSAPRLAVLIDADNSTASVTKALLDEVATYGTPTVKRAYGDWTTPNLGGWKAELLDHAIQPMQQFAYTRGKNSTDSRAHHRRDGPAVRREPRGLRHRLQRQRLHAAGDAAARVGEDRVRIGRRNTPTAFVTACDRFIYLDLLGPEPAQPAGATSGDEEPPAQLPKLRPVLETAIRATSRDDGWSHLGEVGSQLLKTNPAFDPRDYGHTKLGELMRAQSYVEVKDVPGQTGGTQLWVRLKQPTPKPRRKK